MTIRRGEHHEHRPTTSPQDWPDSPVHQPDPPDDETDLARRRPVDDAAFARLVEPLRHGNCTRTATGCSARATDADDALQDALLRAWRGLARFEGRSSLR